MDWREMAGWPTVHGLRGDDRRGWSVFRGAYSDGQKVGTGTWRDMFREDNSYYQWDGRTDPARGWVIAFCWLVTSAAECVAIFKFIFLTVNHPDSTFSQCVLSLLACSATSSHSRLHSDSDPEPCYSYYVLFSRAPVLVFLLASCFDRGGRNSDDIRAIMCPS